MRKLYLLILSSLLFAINGNAQTTVTINCTGTTGSFNSGYVTSAGVKTDGNIIADGVTTLRRGWASFDLSSIPAGSVVNSVTLKFTVTSNNAVSGVTNQIYGFAGTPSSIAGTTLYANCASGTNFSNQAWTQNTTNTIALNATGITFITGALGGKTNIGFVRGAGSSIFNIAGYPAAAASQPQLVITYSPSYKVQFSALNTGAGAWCAGETRNVTLSIKNIGTGTWTSGAAGINLSYWWSNQNQDFNSRVLPFAGLASNQTQVVTVPVTATVAGTFTLNFDLVKEAAFWFRDNSNGGGPGNALYTSTSIIINALPGAPTGTTAQTFCTINTPSPTVANLSATGSSIKWYSAATGGTALLTTTALVSGTHYYASQTNASGCEGTSRLDVTATIGNPAAPTGNASQSFCAINNPTVANLAATGASLKWYTTSTGGTALLPTTALVDGTHYYASQTVGSCESATRFDVTVTVGNPAAPTGTALQTFCTINSPTVADLSANGTAIKWYAASSGGSALSTATTLVNGTHYYASQTISGCESATRYDITVAVGNPTAPTGAASQAFCADANPTVANLLATGTAIQWYSTAIGGTALTNTTVLVNGTHYYASQTISGCESATRIDVTATVSNAIVITSEPNPVSQTICASFPATFTVAASGSITSYQWYLGTTQLSDNSNISGSQTATLTIDRVALSDAGFYHVVISGTAPCADVTSADAELQVNQNIIISIQPAPQILCVGNTATFNVSTSTGTGLTYQWRKGTTALTDGGNISGATTSTLSIANITAADAGNYNVVISDGSAGCPNVNSTNALLTVNATSVGGTINSNASVCSGINSGTLTLIGKTGNVVNWEASTDGGTTWTTIANTTTSQTYTNLTQTTDFRAVVKSGVCPSDNSIPATITVNPLPTITPDATATDVCFSASAQTTQLAYNATTNNPNQYSITWSGTPVNSFATVTNAALPPNPIIISIPANTAPGTYTGTLTVKNANGCVSNSGTNFTVTVIANSTITRTSAAATTAQTVCINTGIVNIVYTIGGSATGATVTGLPGGLTSSVSGNVVTISGTPTITTGSPFSYQVTTTGPCSNPSLGGTITVNDDATISLTSAVATTTQTVCINTPITPIIYAIGGGGTGATLTGQPIGITGSYNAATKIFTISGFPTVAGSFTYNVTTTGPCIKPALSGTVTVQANSTLTRTSTAATTTQTVCINTAIINIVYTIGGGATGATVTGLPAGVTSSISGNVVTISGTPTTTFGSPFSYIITTTGPCVNPSLTGTITVNDDATIALTSAAATTSQTVCISTPIAPITYAIGGGGTGATLSGQPAGITGTYNAGTKIFTISGSPTASGSFTYTVTTTGPCVKPALIGSITVQANSTITRTSAAATTTQTVCINNAITNIVYTIGGSATGAIITGLPAGVTSSINGNVATISGTPTTTVGSPFSYTVTTSGPCVNPSLSGTITINADAIIALTSAAATTLQTICISAPITPITYAIGGGGTGATLSGQPAGITGSYNAGTKIFTISGSPTASGSFTYTVTTTGPCIKPALSGTITVIPNATVTLTSAAGTNAQIVCTNSPITNITYAIGGSGTGANVTGLPAGVNGSYSGGVFTISGTPTVSGTFNYTVTTTGPCVNPSLGGTITVKALPTSTFTATETSGTSNDNIICTGAPITFTATSGYGSYIFKVNGTIVQNGTSNFYSTTTLTNGASVSVDIANALNCGATFGPIIITVNPLPIATLNADKFSICPGDNVIFTAGGGINYNFKINGSSVQSGSANIYSSSLLNNNDAVTVDVTNNNGCAAISTPVVITVNPLPSGTLSATATSICVGNNVTFTATAGFSNYNFKVNGTSVQNNGSNTFSSTTLSNPSVVTVDVTNTLGCVATFNPVSVTVNALPTGTLSATETSGAANDNSICANAPVVFTATTGFSNYDFQVNNVSKQSSSSNTYTNSSLADNDVVKVIVKNGSNCVATFNSITITVVASPTGALTVSPSNAICAGDNVVFTADPGYSNYNFKINGTIAQNGTGNTYTTTGLANGDIITVDVTNTNTCTTTFSAITMVVNPLPTGTLVAVENSGNTVNDGIVCTGATVVFTAPNGFTNYNFLLNNVSVQSGASQTYTTTSLINGDKVSVAVTNGGGCIGLLNTLTITVNTLPIVSPITGTLSFCINSTTTLANATTGGTWSSDNISIATVDPFTGVVTGVASGITAINYTFINTNGCSTTVSASFTVTAPPTVAAISGNLNVCTGGSSQLNDATAGGTWSSDNAAVATVDAAGLVNGVTAGTAIISYTVTDGNGCSTTVNADVTVTTTPTVAPVTTTAPSFDVCAGGTILLKDGTAGGVWSSSNTSIATINSSGLVTGLTAGITTIEYTITTSCSQTVSASVDIAVNAAPSATIAYIGGPFCTTSGPISVNQTGTTGGVYSSASGLTIDASDGTITPATSTGGTYSVTYTVAASGGCSVYTTTTQVTITAAPSATIAYSGPYCTNSAPVNVTRTGTAGGTFTSTPGLSIDAATGTITPGTSTGGTYIVTYTIAASGGCAQFNTTTSVTITTAPTATITYTGGPTFCKSSATVSVSRNGTTGGTYTSAPAGLTVDVSTGIITPASSTAGTYTVTYTIASSGGCAVFTTTTSVIINPLPTATISGTTSACQNGTSPNITFTGAGGTSPYIFTYKINTNGNVTVTSIGNTATVAAPTATLGTFTYTLVSVKDASATACTQNQSGTAIVTINAPTPVTTVTATPSNICLGNTTNLLIQPSTSALLVSENFEGTSTFSVVNGGTNVAASAWKNRTSTYTYNYGFLGLNSVSFNSGSKFMLANSDEGGGVTNTSLVSPTVNTSGYSALTLSYKTYFRYDNSEVAVVEVSTNNGTSWTAVQTLASTTGAAGTFSSQVLNLNAYVNNSSLIIRFRYNGNNNWWWAIDDIQLLATSSGYNYSWTATPAATAGLPGGATTPAASNANIAVQPTASGSYVYTATLTNAAGCTSTKTVSVTVSALPTVSIVADYCAVAGKVRLTANGTSGVTYVWSTGETTQSIDVDVAGNYDVTVAIGTGCPVTATISVANELVVNGDFTNGNTGFTSDYAYKPDIAGNNELVDDSGNNGYSISTNGQNVHYAFWGKDHTNNTTGIRNFMLVNGHGNTLVVWKQTVNVLPNTTYYFSGWAMSLNSAGNYAQLRFSVNGTMVGTTAILAAHGESIGATDNWVRFYGTWTSGPTTTSADIYINDLQAALGGNDFGLDDISFGTLSTFVNLESAPGSDAQAPCINTAITPIQYSVGSSASAPTVTGLPTGVTSSFNGVLLTINGTPTVAGNYTYTVTTTGSCQPTTATGTINVNSQKITLSSGSASPSICVNTPVNIAFILSGTATGATTTGLPGGVTGTVSGTTYTIGGTPTVAGSYPYTITTSGTCGPVTFSGTITVQAQTITLNSGNVPQTICINSPISNIQYTISGTGTGATVTGLPTGVTYSYNSGILFISGTPTASGNFNYTINTSGSCASVSASGTIIVTSNASLNLTSPSGTNAQTSCINTAITNITYAVNDGTGASVSGLPVGITGTFNSGIVTISGTPTVGGTFNYTVTTSGGCGTSTATGTITVQSQTVTLTSGNASPTLCVNAVMPNIIYTIGGTASGATVTGLPAGIGFSISGNAITISGTPTTSVGSPFTYTVTLSGTCTTVTSTGTITISSAATGGTVASVSACSGGNGTLTLTGQAGTIVRWESSVNGGTTWTPITNTTISQTYTNITVPTMYRVVVGNGCGIVYSSVALVGIHNLWTGVTSSDWNTASNWSDGQLPTASPCPTVTIPVVTAPNVYPVLGSGSATINNLVVSSGASLTVTGATLQIAGTVTNSGIFNASNGTIEFNGTAGQMVAAATFQANNVKNLIISNTSAAGVTLAGEVDLYGALTFGSGNNQKLASAGFLNMRSTAVSTARVGDVTNGGANTGNVINGDVVVERYYPGRRAWRLITAPVSTTRTIYNEWQIGGMSATASPGSGTYITSPTGGNGLDVSRQFSLKTFDKTTGQLVNVNNTNVPISGNLKQFNVPDNIGYFMFVRGDRTPTLLNPYPITNYNITTLRDTGVLQTGKKTFGPVAASGFMLVGNPYASPVDFGNLTLTNVPKKFWAWDPRLNSNLGAYVLVDGQSGSGYIVTPSPDPIVGATGQDQHIHSSQAIFVQASATGPGTVEFNENDKSTANNNTVFRPQVPATGAETYENLRANLYLDEGDTAILADGVYEQFSNSFSHNVDSLDGLKFTNFLENLGIAKNGKTLTLERRPLVAENDTIFFKLWNTTERKYQFRFSTNGLNHPGLEGYLEDSYLKTSTKVDLNGYTNVAFTVTGDAASKVTNRFRLVFKEAVGGPLPVTFTQVKAYQQSSNINVEWKVENEINIKQYEVERSADGTSFTRIATVAANGNNSGSINYLLPDENVTSGTFYYRIRSVSNDGKVSYSNIVKVVTSEGIPRIYVYPNPVIAGSDIGIHFINQPGGRYGLRLLNKLGQLIALKQVKISGVNNTQTLPFNKALAHGSYQLEITRPDGSKKNIALIY